MEAPLLQSSADDIDKATKCRRSVVGAFAATTFFALMVALVGFSSKPDANTFLKAAPRFATPIFRITGDGPYQVGLQHGKLAKEQIHGWFASSEMQSVFAYVEKDGRKTFEQLKEDNTKEFPSYAVEMQGIADGAGVMVDQVWCANMLNELESLMQKTRAHCSDFYAIAPGGYSQGFAHGHNDDWSDAVKPYWYFMAVSYENPAEQNKLGFTHCAGVAYPAGLVGWSPTWNAHGIFATQNSLTPRRSRGSGLATTFVQRRATCSARSLDDAVKLYAVPGWADSASMNVIDVRGKRMANIEIWEDSHSVKDITEAIRNYSHFNEFKHLWTRTGRDIDSSSMFVHDPRQHRADSLPAPRSTSDIIELLSDSEIYKPAATLTTLVVNGSTGEMKVWCGVPSSSHSPSYIWNLLDFFQ